MSYTLEEVRVRAKREPFRAGVRMRYVMPRISVRVTRWILNHAPTVTPNQLTVVSGLLGLTAGALLLVPTGIETTAHGLVLMVYSLAFPALVCTVTIARTGHVPRRQDLVSDRSPTSSVG
jgi:uncharacterized membrane protein